MNRTDFLKLLIERTEARKLELGDLIARNKVIWTYSNLVWHVDMLRTNERLCENARRKLARTFYLI